MYSFIFGGLRHLNDASGGGVHGLPVGLVGRMTHPGGRVHGLPVGLVGWVTHPGDRVHGLPVGV
jgi:hypothetical protein